MIRLIVQTAAYLLVVYLGMVWTENPEQAELDWMRKRIEGYRRTAEFCGRRVIALENKYAQRIETGRMN